MTEYISREETLKAIQPRYAPAINKVLAGIIESVPAADVVSVVRCKDCKHYDNGDDVGWCWLHSRILPGGDWESFDVDDYCSFGERRNADG